jgi:hypothetical protein
LLGGVVTEIVTDHDTDDHLRVGFYQPKGKTARLDEVVSGEVDYFHLEFQGENEVWIGVDLKDGRTVHINLWTKEKRIHGRVEVEGK